jgi:hypothetical protein
MKALKISLICIFIGSLAFSCASDNVEKDSKDGLYNDRVIKSLTILLPEQMREHLKTIIGENGELLLTKETQDTMYKCSILLWAYLDYDGKKATYKLSKDEFLSTGLTAFRYDILIANIDILNNFQLTDKDLKKCFDEQFPVAQKRWQEEAEKYGLK